MRERDTGAGNSLREEGAGAVLSLVNRDEAPAHHARTRDTHCSPPRTRRMLRCKQAHILRPPFPSPHYGGSESPLHPTWVAPFTAAARCLTFPSALRVRSLFSYSRCVFHGAASEAAASPSFTPLPHVRVASICG